MSKNRFKVVEFPEHDMLVRCSFNNESEESPYEIELEIQDDDMCLSLKLGFASEEKRSIEFQKMNTETLKQAYEFLTETIEQQGSNIFE